MNILHVSNKPVYPLIDGGCKAMSKTLKALMKSNKVKHICLSTHKHPFNKLSYPKDIFKLTQTEAIYVETKLNPFKAFLHLIFNISYNFNRFYSHEANVIIQKIILENNFDIIVLDSLYSCPYINTIKKSSKAKIIYRAHNVEHRIWKRLYFEEKSLFKRIYLNILSRQLKNIELKTLKQMDAVWSISELDSQYFINKTKLVCTVPMSLEFEENMIDYSNLDLFFIGAYNWKPNLDAVIWLSNVLLPKLHQTSPDIKLHLAGSFSNELESKIRYKKNIIFHGFVEDSKVFMIQNGIFVMPIRTGSGIRVKALEAMALAVPIIATGMAVEGICEENTFFKAETIDEWVDKVHLLRSSIDKRIEISNNALEFVKLKFDQNIIDKSIQIELEKLVA